MSDSARSNAFFFFHVPIFVYLLTCYSHSLTCGLVVVSKAFQVLSDANLRSAFDSHGGDPESRSSGMPSFRSANGDGGMRFENEVSPEELFNMFFGGGFPGGGVPFGGGNGTFFPPAHQPSCAPISNAVHLTNFGILNSIYIRCQRLPARRLWWCSSPAAAGSRRPTSATCHTQDHPTPTPPHYIIFRHVLWRIHLERLICRTRHSGSRFQFLPFNRI